MDDASANIPDESGSQTFYPHQLMRVLGRHACADRRHSSPTMLTTLSYKLGSGLTMRHYPPVGRILAARLSSFCIAPAWDESSSVLNAYIVARFLAGGRS